MCFKIQKTAKKALSIVLMMTVISYLVQAMPLRSDSSGNGCVGKGSLCAVPLPEEQQAPSQSTKSGPCPEERQYNLPPRSLPQPKSSQQQPEQTPPQETKQDFIKNFNRTFNGAKGKAVYVTNKYGRVDIKTWGQANVQVNVRLTVRAHSQEEANVTFNRIDIAFTEGGDFVKSETTIASKTGGSCDYSIDYEVFMPASNPLVLSNRYGNSFIASLNSNANIEQKYGDFSLDGSIGLIVSLGYGTGNIGTCQNLSGSIGYGKLNVGNANHVQLKTKYSRFNFGKIQTADFNSAYDDIKIGTAQTAKFACRYSDCAMTNVEEVQAKGDYSDFVVQRLDRSGVFNTNYGSIRIENITKSVNLFDVQANYTNCIVKIDPSLNFKFDLQANYSGLSRPASIRTSYEQKKGAAYEIIGTVGNEATKNTIRARLNYGRFTIK